MTPASLRRFLCVAFCAFSFCIFGCSRGPQTAPVSGQVTLDGKPAADVRVLFQPIGDGSEKAGSKTKGPGVGSYATTGADGRFVLRQSDTNALGAVIGKHSVQIADKQAESDEDAGSAKAAPARFPARYSDGALTFEVKAGGTDQANFKLTSK